MDIWHIFDCFNNKNTTAQKHDFYLYLGTKGIMIFDSILNHNHNQSSVPISIDIKMLFTIKIATLQYDREHAEGEKIFSYITAQLVLVIRIILEMMTCWADLTTFVTAVV